MKPHGTKRKHSKPSPRSRGTRPTERNDPGEIEHLIALFASGRYPEAAILAKSLTVRQPLHGFGWKALGAALSQMGQNAEALAAMQKAASLLPDDAETRFNLGVLLKAMGQLDETEANYRSALAIQPDYANAHYNLGNTLNALRRLEEAEASYRRALQVDPDFTLALSNLVCLLNYLPDIAPGIILSEAQRYGQLVSRRANPFQKWANTPEAGKCLRIGFVSGDLRAHPVGYFLVGVVEALSAHAPGRIELFAYANGSCSDTLSEQIKAHCQSWTAVAALPDASLAARIHNDRIDILIDLSGHTEHNRLPVFAWKPAPVQASWLGYFGTTGVAEIDYLVADPWTLPESEEAYFTEKIWRLPETRLCFTAPSEAVPVSPLPALANGYVTFACFNNLTKINVPVIALWARILRAIPTSRLFLKAQQFDDMSMRRSIEDQFAAHGIASDRLDLEGASPRAEYLGAYHRADIALDPFPFPGGTTSAESLWMGVPVLTRAGNRFLSRQGEGLLRSAGLEKWIAKDADEYVALAVANTKDLHSLATLRSNMRQAVLLSPLFDSARFARHFEAMLREMWSQWCARQHG
jgi:protein O-GlcNAc transferase